MSQDVTGTSLISADNDVVLFIPPTPASPDRVRLDGQRIQVLEKDVVVSDETYGPITIERLSQNKACIVFEMLASGQHGRAFHLSMEG